MPRWKLQSYASARNARRYGASLMPRGKTGLGGAVVVALAAAVLAATRLAGDGGTESGSWAWDQGLPGTTDLNFQERDKVAAQAVIAISPQVDPSSLRRVVGVGGDRRALVLIAAQDATGAPCLSILSGGGGRQFSCMHDGVRSGAIIRFVADGGPTLGVVEWVTMVGVVRDDVSRLTVLTTRGEERELALNQWRAFAYAPASRPSFPTALRAYGADGSLIEELITPA
jgi:hypothetical protein